MITLRILKKHDRYRGIHLIYGTNSTERGKNFGTKPTTYWDAVRTELKHFWATASWSYRNMLQEPFKFGGTGEEWMARNSLELYRALLRARENQAVMKGYRNLTKAQVFKRVSGCWKVSCALQKNASLFYYGINFARPWFQKNKIITFKP